MKMDCMKRVAASALLFGLAGAVSSQARGQAPLVDVREDQRALDIVIRDFDVSHPDFENFQEEAYSSIVNNKYTLAEVADQFTGAGKWQEGNGDLSTWIFPGYEESSEWYQRRSLYDLYGCGNTQTPQYGIAISPNGYPHDVADGMGNMSSTPVYVQTRVNPNGYAWYGEFTDCVPDPKWNPLGLKTMRGLVNDLCQYEDITNLWTNDWDDRGKCTGYNMTLGRKEVKKVKAGANGLCLTDASGVYTPIGDNGLPISGANGVIRYNNITSHGKACAVDRVCKTHNWSQIVYVTPGMVGPYLKFDPNLAGTKEYVYEPKIEKARSACDNGYFEQWYEDVPGINKSTNMQLVLDEDPAVPGFFEIDKNWNNGGYFPMDSINEFFSRVGPATQFAADTASFGAQSLSIFCPPYHYGYAVNQTDFMSDTTFVLCLEWLKAGGPKVGTAAVAAAATNPVLGPRHLRNYGFTMAGYAQFKYKKGAGEVFEFTGDDDMWIYVDGVLVVDLGGTHLAAAGKVEMDYLAANSHGCHPGEPLADSCVTKLDLDGTWADTTWHYLHFFYADRQTDGSNLRIRSSLSEIAPSRFGQPSVGSVMVSADSLGNQTVQMLLNTKLSENTIKNINEQGANVPAMLIMRKENGKTVVYGFFIDNISSSGSGLQYNMTGVVKDMDGNVVETGVLGGDKIAFNFKYDETADYSDLRAVYAVSPDDPNSPGVGPETWEALVSWSKKMTFNIASSSNKEVAGFPDSPKDWAVTKFSANNVVASFVLDSLISRPKFDEQASKLTEVAKNNGGELPLNYTADLIFASLDGSKNPLNLSNADKALYSAAGEDGKPNSSNTRTFVGGSMSKSSTCFSSDGNESCTSISYPVSGPFHINVRVFDHLGHFVSQYQQSMDSTMLQRALAGYDSTGNPNTGVTTPGCEETDSLTGQTVHYPLYGESGAAWMTIKMYPVSQVGKMLATGPYIYQVTYVQEAYKHCLVANGSPTVNTVYYSRTSDVYKFGYRRENPKKKK